MFSFLKAITQKKRIYLDYASITPVDPRVAKHISEIQEKFWANPNSLYVEGVEASKHLEASRASIARILDVHADEIIFTSGGTESNNLAIEGVVRAWINSNNTNTKPHIVSSVIEHPAVREVLNSYIKQNMCDVSYISVNFEGIIDIKELKKALRPETILVTVMYVNNEIGTIQPIHDISKIVRQYRKDQGRPQVGKGAYPYVHTDACQAALFCPLRIPSLGVDFMTLDSAKYYGPRSSGVLYIRRHTSIEPVTRGGSQEFGLRAGTQYVAHASGFAYALSLATQEQHREHTRMKSMQDFCIQELKKIPHVQFNGTYGVDGYGNALRVPNNINICVPGIDAEYTVLRLDAKGVAVSSVTSCRSKNEDSSSYVVEELYKQPQGENTRSQESVQTSSCATSSLRISMGRYTTMRDLKQAMVVIKKVLLS